MDLQKIAIERRAKVEEFQRKHRAGLLTLLFTDIVDSTKLKQEIGDQKAVILIQQHHAAIREILVHFSEGEEIETAGDSFFIVFTKPSDAVKFSLLVQARLRALSAEIGRLVFDRIGIHVGEVWIEEHEGTGKAQDLYGLQVDTCARVQSLGQGDQILLSRFPFDSARQALKGEELPGIGALSWLNHGPYRMKGVEEPLEICEVGEAGQARLRQPPDSEKAHRFISAESEPVLGWRPAIDQVVPGTGWVLEKKLGEGGFGEVWLGCDKRLKTERVFKFCFRADRVRSLKREATLFGLLKERVGDHPNIVAIESVYFDEPPPYYILMQHVAGQDLASWGESQGGIENVPLETRLEIVAQIADALQAAHDSGVIHRDVKPSNILVSDQSEHPIHAYLTDFGIGQIISDEIRSQLSVSGFSQASLESASLSGTQLYMAPELFWGKPASIRSDIYALGVVLYQLLAGDFRRPVTTDWAKQITDPFLQEDLEKCFAGDPQDRFAGAAQLAEQLRSLAERREAFEKQQAILKDRERAAYRRGILRTAGLALVVIGLVSGLAAYAFFQRHEALRQRKAAEVQGQIANVQRLKAEEQTRAAEEQARIAETQRHSAVASEKRANDARDQADGLINFMLYDLRDKLQPIGRLDVLDDVAKKAKEYLDNLPKELVTPSRLEQQATMLSNLGDVLVAQGKLQEALEAYQRDLAISKRLTEQDKTDSGWQGDLAVSYAKVGDVLVAQGKLQEALEAYQQSLTIFKRSAEQDESNTGWQRDLSVSYDRVGDVLLAQGKLQDALDLYQQELAIAQRLAEQDKTNFGWQHDLAVSYEKVGNVLMARGKLQEALDGYQQSLAIMKRLAEQDKTNSGWQRDLSVGYAKIGDVLVAQGKLQEALQAYQQSLAIMKRLAEQDKTNSGWQCDLASSAETVGNVLMGQGKFQDALEAYQQDLAIMERLAEQDKANSDWQYDLVGSYGKIGDVLMAQGEFQEALEAYQQSLAIMKRLAEQDKTNSGWQRDLSFSYAKIGDVLVAQGKLQEAPEAYQQSLAIMKRLAEQDKTNSDWQLDLAGSYEKVGDVLVAQGDLADALNNYREYFQFTEKLASQDPANADWQNNTAWGRYCVARVLIQMKDGDRNEARRLVIEGIGIMTRLQHQGALDKDAQDTLNKLNELSTALTSSSRK
jgi:tetratricopeptide (TPR) repeat protein/class 3 adenylate cyclase/tRNA A-37 threonylcarbamoyl transferase component Bud32